MQVHFIIPGQPVAKGRPRVTRSGIAFTPAKTRSYEAIVREAAAFAMLDREPLTGPVRLTVRAYFKRVKARPKAVTLADWKAGGPVFKTTRPDVDNVVKAISDGLDGVVVMDDSQVVELSAHKLLCAKSKGPRVEVEVMPL